MAIDAVKTRGRRAAALVRFALLLTIATIAAGPIIGCGKATRPPVATTPTQPGATAPSPVAVTEPAKPAPPAGPAKPAPPAPVAARSAVPLVVPFDEEPSAPRAQAPLTILQINDVYTTVPVNGIGGLARVAQLKQQLQKAGRTPLMVIAGDFLSPSVASSVFKGEQMVAALNAAGLDIAVFGNHEFDLGIDTLRQRMNESSFQWLNSNVTEADGQPFNGSVPYIVKQYGAIKVGFIGLVLTSEQISPEKLGGAVKLVDTFAAAEKYLAVLKQENVDVIVAVTHLSIAEDRRLVERFPEIDLLIGGHEHYPIILNANKTLISKAGSDARFVARIDVNKRRDTVERYFELIPITAAIPDDPKTLAVVTDYEQRLGTQMDVQIATATVALDAEELRLRASETNLGDLFADAMRAAVGADVAIMNSGSIRGDRLYPAGPLTRRTLIAMHPFGNVVTKAQMTGQQLLDALTWGVSKLPSTAGHFPQISGMTMTLDLTVPAAQRVKNVLVAGRPLDVARSYSVALPDYVLDGGDGYSMFPGAAKILIAPEAGELMVTALEKYIAGRDDVAPATTGRITILR